jgi:glutamate synthase domain-containing protein 3
VVEAVGDHGCEYMTGGVVVVLGSTGRNFGAGMSGGIAFVYDDDGDFHIRFNDGMADLEPVVQRDDIITLKGLIEEHHSHTGSDPAARILADWNSALPKFKKIMPRDYRRVLEERRRRGLEDRELEAVSNG